MSIKCPVCKSTDVTSYTKDDSNSDAEKGAVGGAIAGSIIPGIGTIAGAVIGGLGGKILGGSKKKLIHKCLNCGLKWVFKEKNNKNNDPSDIKTKLRNLDSLKDEGLITQEEYDKKRKDILDSM